MRRLLHTLLQFTFVLATGKWGSCYAQVPKAGRSIMQLLALEIALILKVATHKDTFLLNGGALAWSWRLRESSKRAWDSSGDLRLCIYLERVQQSQTFKPSFHLLSLKAINIVIKQERYSEVSAFDFRGYLDSMAAGRWMPRALLKTVSDSCPCLERLVICTIPCI